MKKLMLRNVEGVFENGNLKGEMVLLAGRQAEPGLEIDLTPDTRRHAKKNELTMELTERSRGTEKEGWEERQRCMEEGRKEEGKAGIRQDG